MFVGSVTFEEEIEIIECDIFTDENERNLEIEPLALDFNTPIIDEFLKAMCENRKTFFVNGRKVNIKKMNLIQNFNDYNPYYKKKVDFTKLDILPKVYVYNKTAICLSCEQKGLIQNIENVVATVNCLKDKMISCDISIQYCKNCNRYFVDSHSLSEYEKKYGVVLFEKDESNITGINNTNIHFNPDSILSRYGYTARKGALTVQQRHGILSFLMDNGIATKYDIKNLLSGFIDFPRPNAYDARKIWQADLLYVNEYEIGGERHIGSAQLLKK